MGMAIRRVEFFEYFILLYPFFLENKKIAKETNDKVKCKELKVFVFDLPGYGDYHLQTVNLFLQHPRYKKLMRYL